MRSLTFHSIIRFWTDRRFRGYFFQILMLCALAGVVWIATDNALIQLEKQSIATGFGFLDEVAGFAVSQSLIEYSETSTYGRALFVGLLNTMIVAVLGIITATFIGFVVGIARLSTNRLIAGMAVVYIEIIRNIPLLLQIFFWYFAVFGKLPLPKQSFSPIDGVYVNRRGVFLPEINFEPAMIWVAVIFLLSIIGVIVLRHMAERHRQVAGESRSLWRWNLVLLVLLPALVFFATGSPASLALPEFRVFNFQGGLHINTEFAALWLALSVYTASFIAEIVRAGISSVKRGQVEAGRSLGFHRTQVLRLIIIPQAMRVIIPPLTSQYLNLTKNSSLAVAIAYPDLVSVFAGTVLNQTGQALEIIFITMSVYLIISISTAGAMNIYNNYLLRKGAAA